jgi:antitoxin VapB
MNLQIRNPQAREIAERITRLRNISVADAVVQALEAKYQQLADEQPLAKRLGVIADELAGLAKSSGQDVTKNEIDTMWGHP